MTVKRLRHSFWPLVPTKALHNGRLQGNECDHFFILGVTRSLKPTAVADSQSKVKTPNEKYSEVQMATTIFTGTHVIGQDFHSPLQCRMSTMPSAATKSPRAATSDTQERPQFQTNTKMSSQNYQHDSHNHDPVASLLSLAPQPHGHQQPGDKILSTPHLLSSYGQLPNGVAGHPAALPGFMDLRQQIFQHHQRQRQQQLLHQQLMRQQGVNQNQIQSNLASQTSQQNQVRSQQPQHMNQQHHPQRVGANAQQQRPLRQTVTHKNPNCSSVNSTSSSHTSTTRLPLPPQEPYNMHLMATLSRAGGHNYGPMSVKPFQMKAGEAHIQPPVQPNLGPRAPAHGAMPGFLPFGAVGGYVQHVNPHSLHTLQQQLAQQQQNMAYLRLLQQQQNGTVGTTKLGDVLVRVMNLLLSWLPAAYVRHCMFQIRQNVLMANTSQSAMPPQTQAAPSRTATANNIDDHQTTTGTHGNRRAPFNIPPMYHDTYVETTTKHHTR